MSERPMNAEGPLRPNPDAMHDFLSWWFHDCTRGVVEIGSLQPGTTSLSVFQRFNLNEMEEAAEYAARVNAVAGASTYFRAATISPAATPGRTTDADALQTPGLWADHDSQASVEALASNPLPFKPTGWIITGTVPHMRVQSYWRLSEPLVAMDMVRDLNKRIITVFGCDTTTFNPSRLMRLPGSIAWPVKAGRSIAELTTWQRGENRPSALPLHQVTFGLPEASPSPPPGGDAERPAGGFDFGNTPTRVSEMMAWARTPPQPGAGGHWHETVLKLVAHWVGRGLSSAEILAMAAHLTAPGYSPDQTRRELQTMVDGARRKWDVPDEDRTLDGKEAPKASGEPLWVDMDEWTPGAIPKRPWVVPGYFMRGAVSILSGQGAGGKSSLIVCWTVAGSTGATVGDFKPAEPLIMVNYNVEDELDEQRRRYSAALTAAGSDPAAIRNRVIRCGPHDVGTLFERDNNTGRVLPTLAMAALEKLITDSGADVLICDPLAELHNAEENDNTAMRSVVAAFRSMAKRLNIAVMVLHHDRKGNNTPGDMDRMRGASAVSGAVRVALTLSTMSQEEADKFGIAPEDRRRHFRVDGAKSNYAPAQEAEWWRLDGVEIANGETVAACRPWMPPSAFAGLSMGDCVAVLDTMRSGTKAGRRLGGGQASR
jgi:hypothetical protein